MWPLLVLALALLAGWLRTAYAAAGDPDEDEDQDELQQVVVTSTRIPTLVRDEALHVEAVPTEEIEENLTEAPGNASSLFLELPGLHLESSAAGLGGSELQLRGMPGRDTLVLMDGLPLLGDAPEAFGLLQIPPLDLGQVEVIKGAASALYGSSALGGVVNLTSRTPDSPSTVLVNASSRGGQDLSAFLTDKGAGALSGTLTAGASIQSRQDVNDDGWVDLPYYQRYMLQPRVWWKQGDNQSLFLTAGWMDEDRQGGTMPGAVLPDGSAFPEALHTRRFDLGAVEHWGLDNGEALDGRLSLTSADQNSVFGSARVAYTNSTMYAEEAWSGHTNAHHWVLGAAMEHDQLSAPTVPGVGYTYNVPGLFAQDEYAASPWLTAAGSARVDVQSVYGTFVSPRLSLLARAPRSPWSVRASVAGGYAAPTPFVDEVEETTLAALLPLRNLRAERAQTASLDAQWADEGFEVDGSLFTSEIRDPLEALPMADNRFELVNGSGLRRAPGIEALVGYHAGPLEAIASWTYLNPTEAPAPGVPRDVPLVPHDMASLDAILESERRGRIGFELEYTGHQGLENDPYRTTSPGYIELNVLAEVRFGRISVFVNGLNLTNTRQTNIDPLLTPTPGPGGNPITDVWAPLAGRVFNIGVRAELSGAPDRD